MQPRLNDLTLHQTCMAFDYGSKRIGLAVGNFQLLTARPLGVIKNQNGTPEWAAIDAYIAQWKPSDLIVGWPLDEDGLEQPLCNHIKGFSKRLTKCFKLPVHFVDERYSSVAAQELIRTMRQSGQWPKRSKHEDIDSVAAALILENWFTQQRD